MRTTYDLNNIDYGSLMLQTGYFTLWMDQGRRLRYDHPNNDVRLTFASSLLESFGRYATTGRTDGTAPGLGDRGLCGFLHAAEHLHGGDAGREDHW